MSFHVAPLTACEEPNAGVVVFFVIITWVMTFLLHKASQATTGLMKVCDAIQPLSGVSGVKTQ